MFLSFLSQFLVDKTDFPSVAYGPQPIILYGIRPEPVPLPQSLLNKAVYLLQANTELLVGLVVGFVVGLVVCLFLRRK